MIVVLLGAPGVGKGTQAQMAAETLGWTHLSTGEILRKEVAGKTDLGNRADSFMSQGDLVPDDLMVEVVAGRLEGTEDEVILLDGFPRTLFQARALAEHPAGQGIQLALYFTASDDELVGRLLGRGRADDTLEVARHRLSVYQESTAPLIDLYRDLGILVEIDGERDIPSIQADTVAAVRATLTPTEQN